MHLDDSVGKILAALEKSGKAANTLVVFSSDNGGIPTAQNNDRLYPSDDYDPGPAGGSNVPLRGQSRALRSRCRPERDNRPRDENAGESGGFAHQA